jgi:hypothetical protein
VQLSQFVREPGARADTVSFSYLLLCALAFLLAVVPIIGNTHPPLYDYPFYIARLFILSSIDVNSFISEHYATSSFLIPNIALELISLPLATFLPYETVLDVFVLSICALCFTGTIFFHQTLFGRPSLWPLTTAAFVINWILLFGFLNYTLGVGLFLWSLAGWIRLSPERRLFRHLYGVIVALVLFFVHLAAFGLYAVAVVGFEIQQAIAGLKSSKRGTVVDVIGPLMSVGLQFVPAILLFLLSPTKETGLVDGGFGGIEYDFPQKVAAPLVTLTSGNPWLDALTVTILLILGGLILLFGRVAYAKAALGSLTALIVAYLILPHHMDPTDFVDSRVPVAILFFIVAATQVSFDDAFKATISVCLIAFLLVAKSLVLVMNWREHDVLIEEYLQAFDCMQAESTMFFAAQDAPRSWARKHYVWRMQSPPHVADLATLTGRIFVPSVYTLSGQHTIEVREKFADLKAYQSSDAIEIIDSEAFVRIVRDLVALHRQVSRDRAAYLLLLDQGEPPIPLPGGSHAVARGPGFRLIEIYSPDAPKDATDAGDC